MSFTAQMEKNSDANPRPSRTRGLSEDEIMDRLDELQSAIELPTEVWDFMIRILCPETLNIPPLPSHPTRAMPGTREKLAVMAARAAAGQHLYHPEDALWEDDTADALSITAIVRRNGIPERMSMDALDRQGPEGRQRANTLGEGFLLPAECVVLQGRIPAPQKPRRPRLKPVAKCHEQLLLWDIAS
jgi:hypothetical protein